MKTINSKEDQSLTIVLDSVEGGLGVVELRKNGEYVTLKTDDPAAKTFVFYTEELEKLSSAIKELLTLETCSHE